MSSTCWKCVGMVPFQFLLLLFLMGFVFSPGVCCRDERAPPQALNNVNLSAAQIVSQASVPSRHFEMEQNAFELLCGDGG